MNWNRFTCYDELLYSLPGSPRPHRRGEPGMLEFYVERARITAALVGQVVEGRGREASTGCT